MSKVGLYSSVIFFPSVALVLFFLLFLLIADVCAKGDFTTLQVFILLLTIIVMIVLVSFFVALSRKCYMLETRHISTNRNGFAVRGKHERWHSWKEIGSIAVIAYAADANKDFYQTQMCISFEPISDNELRRLRDSYLYGVFNQDKYILLDYEGIAADRILAQCQVQVEDLRPRQMKL
ncbi:MAG: hypothetical protein J6B67_03020 [Oscillospiraceae bacterium]|nr:hypothetical protein [Oscillospiraceae bacterium]